jgi:hypothetical protein
LKKMECVVRLSYDGGSLPEAGKIISMGTNPSGLNALDKAKAVGTNVHCVNKRAIVVFQTGHKPYPGQNRPFT